MKKALIFCIVFFSFTVWSIVSGSTPYQNQTKYSSQSAKTTQSEAVKKTASSKQQASASVSGNIIIALIDTGISTKAISREQLLEGFNYITNDNQTEDKINHGTAVASLIAGAKEARVIGVAPDAKLVPLIIKSRAESGKIVGVSAKVLAKAIYDAVDKYNANIINMSIGLTEDFEEVREAVTYAEEQNVLVVSSVGNIDSYGEQLYYPAAYPTVIGVGSHNKEYKVSYFSQKNLSVMLLAKGEDIWMASKNGKRYGAKGTSYATAFVSGAAAQLLKSNPKLTPKEIRSILCETAIDLYDKGYDTKSGFGALAVGDR